ncbi:tripartite tricarboxylate transporter TctB family protein [Jannaschia seohaensis]|uniref:Tripartite tricarboxylate transporter TctB family protein n=1 Tax=Jannaschia seohaensis TaxID=475081 RepID=A0A2Y9C3J3_9RHOB|nr:tripartite tricarboxylate transporter TctB family protein [Jannaschia seohaensis]PWJ21645.1 tripartite tricarboxylate transporter TctB family protein [Jannaschia seohaensis]SSA37923.1 Tripartite tricarboxylate transporter TctB family protein [Jannaschia seohaensis]
MSILTERRVTSLVLLLVGMALLSQTFGQAYSGLGAFSPMFFPQIVLSFWVAVAALDLVAELRQRVVGTRPQLLRVTVIALASLVFLLAMTRIGFFLAAVPFSAVALVTLGLRRPVPVAAVSLGVPAALVALFNHLLTLPLPTSPVAWWF